MDDLDRVWMSEKPVHYKDASRFAKRRVAVTGGRNYQNGHLVFKTLYDLCGNITDETPFGDIMLTIIHGGCGSEDESTFTFKGADDFADQWAVVNWAPCEVYRVLRKDWDKWGKAAGPMRNGKMLMQGRPDILVAFPGGSGTANCVMQARAMGIEVMEVRE